MNDVVVNAISARRGGAVRHLTPFLNGLVRVVPGARVTAFISQEFDTGGLDEEIAFKRLRIPTGLNVRRLYWDQLLFPRRASSASLAISPLNIGSVRVRSPHLLFERNSLYFDRSYLSSCPWRLRALLAAHRAVALACVRSADRVVVPTNAMACLLESWGSFEDRISVIPHGFFAGEAPPGSPADRWLEPALAWKSRTIRMLHVGDPGHHKNLPFLADVLAMLRARGADAALAVTIGRADRSPWARTFVARAADLAVSEDVAFLGPVRQDEIERYYRAASVLLFPSMTESFGFPLLEAIAAETPIVAADLPAVREVAGPFARCHPPGDIAAAVDAVVAAVAAGDGLTRDMRREHLDRFSWPRHFEALAPVLNELLQRR